MSQQNIARLGEIYKERVRRVRGYNVAAFRKQTPLMEPTETLSLGHNLVVMHRLVEMG